MSSLATAQTWTPRDDVNANLPASIQVFEDASLGLFYARADLADTDWALDAVLNPNGQTVPSYASAEGTLLAINGGYFGDGQSFSLVQREGTTLSPNIKALNRSGTTFYPTRGAFGLTPARQPDVAWIYDVDGTQYSYPDPSPNAPGSPQPQPTAAFPDGGAPWSMESGIGGGPILVHDGIKRITYDEEVMFGSGVDLTSTRARTAIGYTEDGALLILSAKENPGLTLGGAADILVGLGAVEAVNLDGGGSSQLTAGGVNLVTSARPVVSAVLLFERSLLDAQIIDTGSDCCYRETGNWFESANAPFYGTTKSRLNEADGGMDRAVFIPDADLRPNQVEAWWVPAPN
ncbi:MAG: phosphodiester glycosidase family protein, partial [Bacteroidota bacterium]